jgi:hypothetical protein
MAMAPMGRRASLVTMMLAAVLPQSGRLWYYQAEWARLSSHYA